MELFRQLGLADLLLAKGNPIYSIEASNNKGVTARLEFNRMTEPDTAFPFFLALEQEVIVRVLLDRLAQGACPVVWNTRMEFHAQDDSGATVIAENEDGRRQRWQCSWIIDTDGSLRRQFPARVENDGRTISYFAADILNDQAESRVIKLVLNGNSLLTAVPMRASGQTYITGYLTKQNNGRQRISQDLFKEELHVLGMKIGRLRHHQHDEINDHRTVIDQLRRQRCLLLAAAAYELSPVLGRGLNEGFYDAANLAWKIAGVVSGRMVPTVIDTYQQERSPAVEAADGLFWFGPPTSFRLGWWLRVWQRRLLKQAIRDPARGTHLLTQLSGTKVNYRTSPLSVNHTLGSAIRAGDRLPYLPVFDEKSKKQTDLHRWCEKPGFILLILGTVGHHQLNMIGQWMRQKYPREMHLYYLPYSLRNEPVFRAFEMSPVGIKAVLIRPDMYIAYINDTLNAALIDTYMEEILGWTFFGHLPEKH